MPVDSDLDPDEARLNEAAKLLHEYFDTVQIFATRHEENGSTATVSVGRGNWFARFGQVRSWMTREDERDRLGVWKEEEDQRQ